MINELNLLWLLLPVAAFSGWWIGRRGNNSKDRSSGSINPDYFKGLNFVLNEQPDKAIEVFIRMLEVDSETVETHLALGNLFRRRGEVDRAIRIHQNLIARPTLNREQRNSALLELGMDYMRSGLLDRAEGLFLELINSGTHLNQAYTQLLEIYQQEKDWDKAITIARKLSAISFESYNPVIAQFYCEHADAALNEGNMRVVKDMVRRAMSFDTDCVRASLIEAQMHQKNGKTKLAIKAYKRVESQDSDYITEVLMPLYECYRNMDRVDEFVEYLRMLVNIYDNISILLMLTELIAEREGENAAIRFISDELKNRPTVKGVDKLIEYALERSEGETHEHLQTIKDLTGQLIDGRAMYKCNSCGFDAKSLHWQCPGCKNWDTVKPVFGVAGE
ncbi:MAG: lipopolysaccharide assembly protein LapB [Proteobacteria bacterium]|nr:lipopolysaccharide assembly protein LapB [Pseudomonadota bacterium]NOG61314.1 lipopolysaccharide assembly protein LapB [Pseudomonadota bacterium]